MPTPPAHDADVIVIGAGAAGIAAAEALANAGRRVLLLEARSRVGGRIWTQRFDGLDMPIEVGAEFIHGRAPATLEWLQRVGIPTLDSDGEFWNLPEAQERGDDGLYDELGELMAPVAALATDLSVDDYLDRHATQFAAETRESARSMVQGFDAADTALASVQAIAEEWAGPASVGEPQYRPLGGYGRALDAVVARFDRALVDLRLEHVVHGVDWRRGQVIVRGMQRRSPFVVSAPRAIVTLPLGVLQQPAGATGSVRFAPGLDALRPALDLLGAGDALKVVMRLREPVWERLRESRFEKAFFLHRRDAPFPTFWTSLPLRAPVITAWAGGPRARRLSAQGEELAMRQALRSLEFLFDGEIDGDALHVESTMNDWTADVFARGAYSYVKVGGRSARAQLATPLEDTLFFAGEATDTEGEAATVTGAWQSGLRAARAL